jgi:hypothetical protein
MESNSADVWSVVSLTHSLVDKVCSEVIFTTAIAFSAANWYTAAKLPTDLQTSVLVSAEYSQS